jgi:multimeric flavodoxin WrbA
MKILVLTSSFRKNGNSARLLALLEKSIQTNSPVSGTTVELETIQLAYRNIQPCRGCRACFDRGEDHCPIKDDLLDIKSVIQSSDALILISPVYVEDISGTMKTFIDRLAHVCHRPEFAGKYAYLLTNSGTGTSGHALRTMESALRTWGFYIIGKNNFITGALMPENEVASRFQHRVDQIARQILTTVKKQKALSPSWLSLLFFKVQQTVWQRETEESIDLSYWQEKGWIASRATYYYPHRANPFTIVTARLAGGIIALFF